MSLQSLKERVWSANRRLHEVGLAVHAWGNASARDAQTGLIAIKPSGFGYQDLTPAIISVVDAEGNLLEGGKPSSDTPTHLELYRAWPSVGGVVHTHSPCATAWAQALRPLPCLGTTHADHFLGSVPITEPLSAEELDVEYEKNTGKAILRALDERDPLEMPAVLVASHGPFAWGATVEDAVTNASVLEYVARMAFWTLELRPDVRPIGEALLRRHFFRKHGPTAYYGQ